MSGQQDRTLFTEVFWADRSSAPAGILATFADVVWNLLGIAYIALDNATNTASKPTQWVVRAFVWLFFAIIAPVNAMLGIGVAVLIPEFLIQQLDLKVSPEVAVLLKSGWIVSVIGGIAVFIAAWLSQKRDQTLLLWRFWQGLIVLGVATLALGIGLTINPELHVYPEVLQSGFETPVEHLAILLFSALSLSWWTTLLLCFLCYLMWASELVLVRRSETASGQTRIFAPVCSGMVFLWMTVQFAFWAVVFWFMLGEIEPAAPGSTIARGPELVALKAFSGVFMEPSTKLYGFAFILLVGLMIFLVALRGLFRKNLNQQPDILSRLILNPAVQVVFAGTTLVTLYFAMTLVDWLVEQVLRENGWRSYYGLGNWFERPLSFFDFLDGSEKAFSLLFLSIGLASYYGASVLSNILGIARDVVVYTVMARPTKKRTGYSGARPPMPGTRANPKFPVRAALEGRFERVLTHTLRHNPAHRLTVIAHSSGSVIAVRRLMQMRRNGTLPENMNLITMGSPISHIFGQYFPEDFRIDDGFAEAVNWHNFYRTGDYVGTTVVALEPGETDIPIGIGGHTGYWTDARFWNALTEHSGFKLF